MSDPVGFISQVTHIIYWPAATPAGFCWEQCSELCGYLKFKAADAQKHTQPWHLKREVKQDVHDYESDEDMFENCRE